MAFVNEYVSQEDIEKYELIKLINYYYSMDGLSPFDKKTEKLSWTIDKERELVVLCTFKTLT